MSLTREQALEIRLKRQAISKGLTELLCEPAESDHEYYLNILIAQKELTAMLSKFEDVAFMEWNQE